MVEVSPCEVSLTVATHNKSVDNVHFRDGKTTPLAFTRIKVKATGGIVELYIVRWALPPSYRALQRAGTKSINEGNNLPITE